MSWSPQQDAALMAVNKWLKNSCGQQVFKLFGFAGTGKTTLARHIAQAVDGEVLFAAFTGKAASVLRSKGCTNASTIHRLIYRPANEASLDEMFELLFSVVPEDDSFYDFLASVHDSYLNLGRLSPKQEAAVRRSYNRHTDNQPAFEINPVSNLRHAKLLIVDEVSMVDTQLGTDLLSFEKPILVLGDPAQLPPIKNGASFFDTTTPDVMLTEIHRQALDNPIIAMSMLAREGRRLPVGTYGNSRVLPEADRPKLMRECAVELASSTDQILIGLNATRRKINSGVRNIKGYADNIPMIGDKLVCLRNNYASGLLNGTLWEVLETKTNMMCDIMLKITDSDTTMQSTTREEFFTGEAEEWKYSERVKYDEFDYGYALTVHKAQGSQWKSVTLVNEASSFYENHARWLYTGLTRAEEKIIVVT